jgi:hypothetical protein
MPRYYDDDLRRRPFDDDDYPPRRRYRDDDDLDISRRRRLKSSGTTAWLVILGVVGVVVVSSVIAVLVEIAANAQADGPVNRQAAMDYVQLIDDATDRILEQFRQLKAAVEDARIRGGKNNGAAVRRELDAVKRSIKAAATDMQSWAVPKSNSARRLHEGFRQYLLDRERACQDLGLIPAILDDESLTLEEKQQRTDDLLNAWSNSEQMQFDHLEDLRQEMAREHDIP